MYRQTCKKNSVTRPANTTSTLKSVFLFLWNIRIYLQMRNRLQMKVDYYFYINFKLYINFNVRDYEMLHNLTVQGVGNCYDYVGNFYDTLSYDE